jgi:hypothetical protein
MAAPGIGEIVLMDIMTEFVPATTRTTAVGFEKPTRADRVEE